MNNILIHGLGQNEKSWTKVINYMNNDVPIITPNLFDLLKNNDYNYDVLYNKFEKEMNQYDSVDLCGLSLGGILALHYAKENPSKVNSLVLIGVPFTIPKLLFNFQLFVFKFMPQSTFLKLGISKDVFHRFS